ncbi:MAG: hypothetical protein KC912_06690 [Proteobacteria bacterium]|nr:hypothetical protein [Pseudomonadota bacterium]
MRGIPFVLLALLLSACPKRGDDEQAALALSRAVQTVDARWDARGTEGFDGVHEALTAAEVAFPGHPEIAWRWARHSTGLGLAAEDTDRARHHFAEARGSGLQCLLSDPVFDARQAEVGWEAALDALKPDRELCAVWTVFAWLRWVEHVGARAAELDFERIDALVERLRLSGVDPDARVTWSRGLAQVMRDRADGLSSPRGRALLAQSVDAAPSELARTADLLLVGGTEVSGDGERYLERALRAVAKTPEDRRALTRLRAIEP